VKVETLLTSLAMFEIPVTTQNGECQVESNIGTQLVLDSFKDLNPSFEYRERNKPGGEKWEKLFCFTT
jgi:hypothetical protein